MDRQIVYPASIPLDTDILGAQRDAMIALGYLLQATLGTTTVVDGLACTPTSPASLTVSVGPGCITQLTVIDATAYGSIPSSSDPLMKLGINVGSTQFSLTPPTSTGQSINYLIEASFLEADATPVVLPYYNANNPAQPYSGPGNTGATQNTQRLQSVQLQVKSAPPGPTGSQPTPSVDLGWVGLWIVAVPYGATAITNIMPYPTAPFITYKLPQLTPGTHNILAFSPTTQRGWTVPAGVTSAKVRLWGGGGAGGAGFGGAGGGGAGGGYSEGFYGVTPGAVIAISVGNGGAGSGSNGGTSSFGELASATGGVAGGNGQLNGYGPGGGQGGTGSGSGFTVTGSAGGAAFGTGINFLSGVGGSAFGGAGAVSVVGPGGSEDVNGNSGINPGTGGSGGLGAGVGGNGGPGLVVVEW